MSALFGRVLANLQDVCVLLGGDAFPELGGHLEAGVLGAPVVQDPLGVARVAPSVRVVHRRHRLGRTRRAKYQDLWITYVSCDCNRRSADPKTVQLHFAKDPRAGGRGECTRVAARRARARGGDGNLDKIMVEGVCKP